MSKTLTLTSGTRHNVESVIDDPMNAARETDRRMRSRDVCIVC